MRAIKRIIFTLQLLVVIVLLCYVPLDYGATSVHSQLVFVSVTTALLSLSFLGALCNSSKILQSLSWYKSDLLVLLLLIMLYLVYIIPVPTFFIEWVSPKILHWHEQVQTVFTIEKSAWLSLSIDRFSSKLELAVYMSAFALCAVIILHFELRYVYALCWTALLMIMMQIGLHYYFQANDIEFIPISLIDGHHYRFNGTFVNSNHISAFLNTLMFMVFIILLCCHSLVLRFRIMLVIFMTMIIVFYQIKIGSRTGFISPFLALMLVLMATLFIRRELVKYMTFGLMCLMLLLALWVLLFPSREISFGKVLTFETLQERFIQWHATWNLIKDYLWFGVGLGNYESAFVLYKTEELSPFRFSHAHNTWIQLIAETGVVSSTLFFGYLICIFKRLLTCLRLENIDVTDKAIIILLATGGVNFVLQGMMDSLFVAKAVLIVFFVYIAITVIIARHIMYKNNN